MIGIITTVSIVDIGVWIICEGSINDINVDNIVVIVAKININGIALRKLGLNSVVSIILDLLFFLLLIIITPM